MVLGVLLVVASIWAVFVIVAALTQTFDLCSFDQEILVETKKPIQEVTYFCYFCGEVDAETRQHAEKFLDPLLDCEKAEKRGEKRYSAIIMYEKRTGGFRKEKLSSYPRHLVVFVKSVDGGIACRVVDLPKYPKKEPVVLRFP